MIFKTGWQKLLLQLLVLLVILIAADRIIGMYLERVFYKQTHGDDHTSIYAIEKAEEEVLVFGSSRASHHYVASAIETGSGMTCFNGGRDEMTITYIDAVLSAVFNRTRPKVVIIDLFPSELDASPNNAMSYQRIATVLMPFLHKHPELASTIQLAGYNEYLKAKLSGIYPYNSLVGSMMQNTYTRIGHSSEKGYEPLEGTIDSVSYTAPMGKDFNVYNNQLDDTLVQKLQHVIEISKQHHARLITVISPFYFRFDFSRNKSFQKIRELLAQNQCELYDFSGDSRFVKKPLLFKDDLHLNDSGAHIFTRSIVEIINAGSQPH